MRTGTSMLGSDLVGATIVAVFAGWLLLAAARGGQAAVPALGPLTAATGGYVLARIVSRWGSWQLPLAVAVGAATIALSERGSLLDRVEGPLGYANATATFFVLAACCAAIVAWTAPFEPLRVTGFVAAVGFAAVPWLNGSRAAVIMTCTAPLAFWARRPRVLRAMILTAIPLVLVMVVTTAVIGVGFATAADSSTPDRVIDATVSGRRVDLWHDAVALTRSAPLLGGGLGTFRDRSPTALAHPDTAWAHSEYLQLAAESGVPGSVLLVAVILWGYARLWNRAGDDAAPWALLAWSAVAVHASLDYILHFPGVVAIAGVLLGGGRTQVGPRAYDAPGIEGHLPLCTATGPNDDRPLSGFGMPEREGRS